MEVNTLFVHCKKFVICHSFKFLYISHIIPYNTIFCGKKLYFPTTNRNETKILYFIASREDETKKIEYKMWICVCIFRLLHLHFPFILVFLFAFGVVFVSALTVGWCCFVVLKCIRSIWFIYFNNPKCTVNRI